MATEHEIRQLLADMRTLDKAKRRTAVYKLGMIGGDTAAQTLIDAVGNTQEDLIVRGRAAQMLGKLRDVRAVYALITALGAPGYQTPVYAAQALGVIGDRRALTALRQIATTHINPSVRDAASSAITQIDTANPAPPPAEPQLALEE